MGCFRTITARAAFSVLTAISSTAAPGDPYRFAVVGHVRGGPGNGAVPTAKLERLVHELRRHSLDFVVLTGDIVWGDFEPQGAVDAAAIRRDWEHVDALLERVGVPIHRAPGNHDVWDPVTRDLWLERYGTLHRSFEHRGSRFLLLNSCWTPSGDSGRTPGRYIRGAPLPPEQIEFVRATLAEARGVEHVFVFLHHMLWWDESAPWWADVHPLLAAAPTRSVIAGDLGPWKFSREQRDGVQYIQSALDFTDRPPLVMLRNREESRAIVTQLDNYVLVTVDGPRVEHELRIVEAFEGDAYSPRAWREIYAYDAGTFERRLFQRVNTPRRALGWLIGAASGALVAGLALGGAFVWWRSRERRA